MRSSHGKGEYAPHGALLCRRRAMGSNDLPPYALSPTLRKPPPSGRPVKPVPPAVMPPESASRRRRPAHPPRHYGTERQARPRAPAAPVRRAPARAPAGPAAAGSRGCRVPGRTEPATQAARGPRGPARKAAASADGRPLPGRTGRIRCRGCRRGRRRRSDRRTGRPRARSAPRRRPRTGLTSTGHRGSVRFGHRSLGYGGAGGRRFPAVGADAHTAGGRCDRHRSDGRPADGDGQLAHGGTSGGAKKDGASRKRAGSAVPNSRRPAGDTPPGRPAHLVHTSRCAASHPTRTRPAPSVTRDLAPSTSHHHP